MLLKYFFDFYLKIMIVNISSFEMQKIFHRLSIEKSIKLATSLLDNIYSFNIYSEVALSHFLSQAGHESMEFGTTQENLNYSDTQLVKMWPKRFSLKAEKGKLLAKDYAHDPELIANTVYARKELGNGDVKSGDGWNFHGRGFIQLTGKTHYENFVKFYKDTYHKDIDLMENPDILATDFNLAMISALWFFQQNVMKRINIQSASVEQVTRLVNGGYNGLQDRKILFNRAIEVFHFFDLPDRSNDSVYIA